MVQSILQLQMVVLRPSSTMDAEMSTVPGKIFIPVIPVNRKLQLGSVGTRILEILQ